MADGFTEEQVRKMVQIMSALPPAAPVEVEEDLKDQCICGYIRSVTEFEPLDTGVFKTVGNVCRNCAQGHEMDKNSARLVCARCKRVIMNLKPHKCPRSGFEFKPGRSYHLTECKLCNPSIERAQIIEKALWHRNNNIPT